MRKNVLAFLNFWWFPKGWLASFFWRKTTTMATMDDEKSPRYPLEWFFATFLNMSSNGEMMWGCGNSALRTLWARCTAQLQRVPENSGSPNMVGETSWKSMGPTLDLGSNMTHFSLFSRENGWSMDFRATQFTMAGPGPLQELKATDAWTLFQSIDYNEDFKINLEAIERKRGGW